MSDPFPFQPHGAGSHCLLGDGSVVLHDEAQARAARGAQVPVFGEEVQGVEDREILPAVVTAHREKTVRHKRDLSHRGRPPAGAGSGAGSSDKI